MAILHINVQNGSDLSLLKGDYYTNPGVLSPVLWSYSLGRSRFDDKFINENKNYYISMSENTYEFGDILVYFHCYGDGQVACNVRARGGSSNLISFTHDNSGSRPVIEYYLDFAVDSENHKGYLVVASLQHVPYAGNNWQEFIWLADGGEALYNLLITQYLGGGAGSGYIGNSLVSNKKMVGYNVPTSDVEGTKTESVNDVSASAVSGKPKSGNGFVRIKFLRSARTVQHQTINHTITSSGNPPYDVDTIQTQISIEKDIVYYITANITVHSNGANGRIFSDILSDTAGSQSYQVPSSMSEMKISLSEIVCESQSSTLSMRVYHKGLQNKVIDIEISVVSLGHS